MKALHALQHSALGAPELSFKNHENAFLIDSKGQKKVFVHFKDFGQLDRVHIAYCDNEYCFLASCSATRSLGFIQKSQNSIFNWSKGSEIGQKCSESLNSQNYFVKIDNKDYKNNKNNKNNKSNKKNTNNKNDTNMNDFYTLWSRLVCKIIHFLLTF